MFSALRHCTTVAQQLLTQQVRSFQCTIAQTQTRGLLPTAGAFHQLKCTPASSLLINNAPLAFAPNMIVARGLNRNARRPTKSNHGKRPVSHARKRAKAKTMKSRLHRVKIFGFW